MKKQIYAACVALTVSAFCLFAADLSFDNFRDTIKNAVPQGFILNTQRTSGNRFSYRVVFDGDRSKMETLSFNLIPGSEEFSEMSLSQDPERFEMMGLEFPKDRP